MHLLKSFEELPRVVLDISHGNANRFICEFAEFFFKRTLTELKHSVLNDALFLVN